MLKFLLLILTASTLLSGCGAGNNHLHLSQDEARRIIDFNPQAILLDVRTQEEYCRRHITNAVLLPVEDLRAGVVSKLANKSATLIIYSATGRRAKEAADILSAHGYENVHEMGGMLNWTGAFMGTETD